MKTEVYISKNQPDMKKLNELLSRPVHSEMIYYVVSEELLDEKIKQASAVYLEF